MSFMVIGMQFRIAIIIVSYNSETDIENCVRSAVQFCYKDDRVIVVDNASTDNSRAILKKLDSEMKILRVVFLDRNVGFGPANNIGFKEIQAKWYFLLNADAWLLRDSINSAIAKIDHGNSIAVCGIPLIFPDGSPQTFAYPFTSFQKWILQLLGTRRVLPVLMKSSIVTKFLISFPLTRNYVSTIQRPTIDFNDTSLQYSEICSDVDWVCGAAMIIRGDFVREFGGFDDNIFLYGEDEDLCIMAYKFGKRVVFCDTYPVVHKFGWGNSKFNPVVAQMKYKSLRYFINKNISSASHRSAMLFLLPFHVYGFKIFLFPALDQEKTLSLIDRLTIIDSKKTHDDFVSDLFSGSGIKIIGFINAHAVNIASKDTHFASSLNHCDILLRDGIGLAFMLRMIGRVAGLNMNGTDFIPTLIQTAIKLKYNFILLGTREPYNVKAATLIQSKGGKIILVDHGFHDEIYYLNCLKRKITDNTLIILGMGMPKQESLALKLKNELNAVNKNTIVVCGGAILDFIGGKVYRAPKLIRRLRFEWLYRLYKEPRRLFHRYVIGNIVFLLRIPLVKLHIKLKN